MKAARKTSPAVDPILAAIERHRVAHEAFGEAVEASDHVQIRKRGGNASPRAMAILKAQRDQADAAEERAWRHLFGELPSTTAGLLAVMRHAGEHYDSMIGMDDPPDVFGSLAVMTGALLQDPEAVAARSSAAQAEAVSDTASSDPIYEALFECLEADRAYTATFTMPGQPEVEETPELMERRTGAGDAVHEIWNGKVLETVPTTARGAGALARFASGFLEEHGCELDEAIAVLALIGECPALRSAPLADADEADQA
ncbi:hypothetical protein OPKNFCMD_5484 [Methylobacterium crusticola]|uniref:DUF3102 domain-containing protein n=1 Tax=Methylobacterium crusticola TaxID=1697972 RepID=A0ABQ4R7K4_9HYPH|nr:hypothetical protein [Methylobacterium crusticola]GJD52717.1 hypothetical protein OPKNFCMD_5484 [Methylobacterium crusticola]